MYDYNDLLNHFKDNKEAYNALLEAKEVRTFKKSITGQSLNSILLYAFSWHLHPKGFDYFDELYEQLREQ
jgi:hypothetical protein